MHAFVSATRAHESWGFVLDEAVALGLPLVLPRSGAYAERMHEGEGALFYDPGSDASLTAVVERLLAEPALLSTLRARLPAARTFTPSVEDVVRAHLALRGRPPRRAPPVRPVPGAAHLAGIEDASRPSSRRGGIGFAGP